MELTEAHIKNIREAFLNIETREHLLALLNYAKPFVYGKDTIPFALKQLTYYSRNNTVKYYKKFKIKKKSGGERTITAPVRGLKAIQKTLSLVLQCVFEPHPAATGFVKDKSIVDNAKVHVGNRYVYNIDLKDFFQSIDQARVWKCLQLKPFFLNDEFPTELKNPDRTHIHLRKFTTNQGENIYYKIKGSTISFINDKNGDYKRFKKRIFDQIEILKEDETLAESLRSLETDVFFSQEVLPLIVKKYIETEANLKEIKFINNFSRIDLASFISNICCTEITVERKDNDGNWIEIKKNVLPQGAPTSPLLSNVVCQRLDYLLTAVARRFGLKYSRYADDITFSALHNVFQKDGAFLKEMERVIIDQGFTIKPSKTRLQVDGMQKVVTGLVVNDKVNVKKRYVKQLRMWLHYWETYGYFKAERIFKSDYFKDKGHVKTGEPNLSNVLDGKLNYLQMVKGADDSTYVKLKERFDKLNENTEVNEILQIWEEQGIEKAIAASAPLKPTINKVVVKKKLLNLTEFL